MKRLMEKLKGVALAAMCMGFALGAQATSKYCVIDLSGGTSASSYPVEYTDTVPACGWTNDLYKTTSLVLRLVEAGSVVTNTSNQAELVNDKPYYAGIFPVTRAQYSRVVSVGSVSDVKTPMVGVSWQTIMGTSGFVSNLMTKAGISINLPTEAQWEYACRAGTSTTYYFGDTITADTAGCFWFSSTSSGTLKEVGTAPKEIASGGNPWGLYDMHGNVDELTASVMSASYSTVYYVVRGGYYSAYANRCTSSSRNAVGSTGAYNTVGFRIVSDDIPEETKTTPKYCIVDLSGGTSASSYPVEYTDTVPACGWTNDLYKTTSLVLRLVEAGSVVTNTSNQAELVNDKPYYAGIFPVTRAQYSRVVSVGSVSDVKTPMVGVSWQTIMGTSGFVSNLMTKAGISINLPTEAQWEYACRAGTSTTYYFGDTITADTAGCFWFSSTSSGTLKEVGMAPKEIASGGNPWGLYDMHGNVDELTASVMSASYSTVYYVVRGGYYSAYANRCTSSSRNAVGSTGAYNTVGFRIVSDEVPVTEPEESLTAYCVIDLSGGVSAQTYPVTYTNTAPAGGWNDVPYKTTNLVLRLVETGSVVTNAANQTKLTNAAPYYVSIFPVTEAQYSRVVSVGSVSDLKTPMVGVSWQTIAKGDGFITKLVAKTGLPISMPTEQQWEYACRAGTSTTYYFGDKINADTAGYFWFSGTSSYSLKEVGTAPKEIASGGNPWGLFDMHGNVIELAANASDLTECVGRGGAYNMAASYCASSWRTSYALNENDYRTGFRIVSNGISDEGEQESVDDYVVFSGDERFVLSPYSGVTWNGTIYWSTNLTDWATWHGEQIQAGMNEKGDTYCIYLYGNAANTHIMTDGAGPWQLFSDGLDVSCSGNIEALRGAKGDAPSPTQMEDYCYAGMFASQSQLVSAPDLPAKSLSKGCYRDMFLRATALTLAPSLPATSLADNCYETMFASCESLIEPPTLPATQLADSCYYQMFYNCTKLKSAPSLPAANLKKYCYGEMFALCSNLETAPQIAATKVAEGCCKDMFRNCTSLTNAPTLYAEEMAGGCYSGMFYDCKALTDAPVLPATTLATNCYYEMFRLCSALTNAPALPATILAASCYNAMFNRCSSLTTAPSLPAETLANYCYSGMFKNCSALTTPPALNAISMKNSCYFQMFENCTSLKKIPALAKTQDGASDCFGSMFNGCTSLVVNVSMPGRRWYIGLVTFASEYTSAMFANTAGNVNLGTTVEPGVTYYVESDWKREIDLGGGMTARDYYDGDWAIVGNGEVAAAQTALLKDEPVTNLWIHTGVTGIGASAFTDKGFWTLRDVTLGADCTSVGERAFKRCYGLTNVTSTATGASNVGDYAFSGCHSLQGLSFAGAASFGTQSYTLQAAIYMKDGGIPVVYAMPTITVAGKSEHIMGKKTLADEWTDVTNFTDEQKKDYHFFKIEMK